MGRVRRSPYVLFYLDDDFLPDAPARIRGAVSAATGEVEVLALVILTGEFHAITRAELDLLVSLPGERWVDEPVSDPEAIHRLARKGLVIRDGECGEGSPLVELRERDEKLSANEWNLFAALYHFMTQWSGVRFSGTDLDAPGFADRRRATVEAFIAEHGPPPEAFPDRPAGPSIRLPDRERDGGLFRALRARRTTRSFDTDSAMTLDELDGVLKYAFGCHGYARSSGDLLYIKRTSPSGGGLHPIEVYPVVSNVEGVAAGIYHYDARHHGLRLLAELTPQDARNLATDSMCGQEFFGRAHVSFVMTARFFRNYWKYRRHPKAYAGILMDAAHLSQTLQLVSAELGLGAFITLAVNGREIERRLGLDGVSEGVIAMTGCGRRGDGESPLELHFSTRPSR